MKRKLLFAIVALLGAIGAKAQDPGDDMTSYITNPTFTDNADGWNITGSARYYNGKGFDGTTNFIELTNWGSSWDATISQTVTLPNGYYLVKAAGQMSGTTDCWMKLVANGAENQFSRNGDTNGNILANGTETTIGSGVAGWRYTSVIAKVTNGSLEISCVGHSDIKERWANFDAVSLTYLGTILPDNTDVTSYINNHSFETGDLTGWTLPNTSSDTGVKNNVDPYTTTGIDGSKLFNTWWQGVPLTQTISNLPNGLYTLKASLASSDAGVDAKLFLLAGGGHSDAITITHGTSGQFNDYTYDFSVENGSTTIGAVGGTDDGTYVPAGHWWYKADNFRLIYRGARLSDVAVELPAGGAMEADTWYYFNPGAADFNLTATDLSKIVYTSDGTILTSAAESISTTFGANPVTLTNTTYYIKSSIANNFAYEADSYDLTEQIAAYNTAVTNAGTAKTNAEAAAKVNAAEKTALDNAITTYGSIDYSGPQNKALKDALETATAALTSATNAVNTSITAYANAKTYFDAVEPVLATTNAYTSAAYASNYSTPKAAYEAGTLSDVDAAALSYGSRRDGSMPVILLSSWAGTTLYINTWSSEAEGVAPARDFANPFFEYWIGDGDNLGATTFTSTIGGLTANALYAVTLNARVKQRNGNRKVADGITMKVGEGDAVDLTQGLHIGTTRRFIDSFTAYGYTDGEGNLVTTITVAENSNISWLAFRDMNYGRVEGATALDQVISEVTDLNGHVPTNVYSTASDVVTSHTGGNYPDNDADFATAISEIRAAAATAAAYKDEYEAYLELKDYADALVAVPNNNASANSTLATAISTAATNVNSVADVAALTSVNTTLKAAMVTYAGAANPVGDGQKFDLTFMLGKVNFDDCIAWENPTVNGFGGWATDQGDGNFQVMQNNDITSGDYHSFMEYWSAEPKTSNFNLYTTVEDLPEGTYTMSCYAFANANGYAGAAGSSEVYFYANDTQGGKVSDSKLTQKEITFVNASEQDVKIGLKPVTGNTWRWMGIGYVKMYKVPAAADVVLNENSAYVETETAADVVLTKTIYQGFNTVILPFSMTAEEVADVLGAGTLYAFTDADAGVLDFSSVSSLAAHTPYLFEADADKAIAGQRIAGRTITTSTNSLTTVGTDYNFVGTYAPYAQGESPIIVGTDYVLGNDNNFYQATVKNAMKAFRAYIKANEPSLVKALVISLDGEATGIQSINGQSLNEGAIYNLAGQRMNKVQRGVNIVNGKKVLVK